MSYFGVNGIGKLFLGSTEISKTYLGTRLVYQSGGVTPPPTPQPTINYLVYGNPTINGTSYIPDTSAKGFIYTNAPFNPGTSAWTIQTRIRINSAIAWRDLIASVDANGASQYSIVVQTNTNSSNQGYGLYLSRNGTSWNLRSNSPTGAMGTGTWYTFQIVCTKSGSRYVYKMGFPELDSWTSTYTSAYAPVFGKYISFAGGFDTVSPDCEVDLSETKIWIGSTLWWEAITYNQ